MTKKDMWKWIAGGIAAVAVVLLGVTYYIYEEPSIPRAVQFVMLPDGARVHYRDRGLRDAPVLLLLHGSNSSLFDWEDWSKSLSIPIEAEPGLNPLMADKADSPAAGDTDLQGGSRIVIELKPKDKNVDLHKLVSAAVARVQAYLKGFRVISVDLPGHGLTGAVPSGDYSEAGMVAFVKAFADKLGLQQFALAGNSMGGGVAARFAEVYPGRVTHLILVDAHAEGIGTLGSRIPFAFKLARTPVLGNLLLTVTPRSLVVEGLEDAVAYRTILTDDFVDRYWDFARMAGTRRATLMRFRLPPDPYVRDHLARIKAPTLILWGADDRLLPVADGRAWATAIPGSRLIVYPRTGHLPMEEVPEKSAKDVRAFLSGTP